VVELSWIDPFFVFENINCKFSILLESNYSDKRFGRYSFIFTLPKEVFVCSDKEDVIDYLHRLDKIVKSNIRKSNDIFNGGLAGYLSYDFGVDLYNVKRKIQEIAIPKAFFGYYEDYIIFDHFEKKVLVSSSTALLDKIRAISLNECNNINMIPPKVEKISVNFKKEDYKKSISKIKEYIYEGDVYQVNLSQQFKFEGSFDPRFLYYHLRNKNYGAYHAFINLGDYFIISTSPELFIQKRKNKITTKPIKGTIMRTDDEKINQRHKEKLYYSEKCRAELLMIVDLERNDLAKICIPNSIEVEKLYDIEEFSTVYHLVSTISGNLKEDVCFSDIIKAMFPGGSITGAPKLNAIKIIEELEKCPRGIYTGSIGYVSNNFNMDFNIAIRTLIVSKNQVFYNVGGGIVWDSDEEDEYEETLHKGKALYNILMGRDCVK